MVTTTLLALAAACPMLAGTYNNCVNTPADPQDKTEKVEISQVVENGAMVYTVKSTEQGGREESQQIIADGQRRKVHEETQDGMTVTAFMTATCPADNINAAMEIFLNNDKFMDARVDARLVGNTLETKSYMNDGSGEKLSGTTVCQKAN